MSKGKIEQRIAASLFIGAMVLFSFAHRASQRLDGLHTHLSKPQKAVAKNATPPELPLIKISTH